MSHISQKNNKAWYPYVGELKADIQQEIQDMTNKAIEVFAITETENGDKLAERIFQIVQELLMSGDCPKGFANMTEAAIALGCLYGHAYVIGHGWSWKAVGDGPEKAMFVVVSPEEDYCIPVLSYINRFLSHPDPTGETDNTVLLLYNMMEESVMRKPERKLTMVS